MIDCVRLELSLHPNSYSDALQFAILRVEQVASRSLELNSSQTGNGTFFTWAGRGANFVDGFLYLSQQAPFVFGFVIEVTGEAAIFTFHHPSQLRGREKRRYNIHFAFAESYLEKMRLGAKVRQLEKVVRDLSCKT